MTAASWDWVQSIYGDGPGVELGKQTETSGARNESTG